MVTTACPALGLDNLPECLSGMIILFAQRVTLGSGAHADDYYNTLVFDC